MSVITDNIHKVMTAQSWMPLKNLIAFDNWVMPPKANFAL
jgi:hypothetical protein